MILVDSGSTDNSIDERSQKHRSLVQFPMADRRKLPCSTLWLHFKWKMNGHKFLFPLRISDLGVLDVILGVEWKKS